MLLLRIVKTHQVYHQRLRHIRQPQRNIRQHLYRLHRNLHVHIIRVLIQLIQHVPQIVLIGQHAQNIDLNVLDIRWFVIFAIKVLEVLFVLALAVHVPDHVFDVLQDNEGCFA